MLNAPSVACIAAYVLAYGYADGADAVRINMKMFDFAWHSLLGMKRKRDAADQQLREDAMRIQNYVPDQQSDGDWSETETTATIQSPAVPSSALSQLWDVDAGDGVEPSDTASEWSISWLRFGASPATDDAGSTEENMEFLHSGDDDLICDVHGALVDAEEDVIVEELHRIMKTPADNVAAESVVPNEAWEEHDNSSISASTSTGSSAARDTGWKATVENGSVKATNGMSPRWQEDEDQLLLASVAAFGTKWKVISKLFKARFQRRVKGGESSLRMRYSRLQSMAEYKNKLESDAGFSLLKEELRTSGEGAALQNMSSNKFDDLSGNDSFIEWEDRSHVSEEQGLKVSDGVNVDRIADVLLNSSSVATAGAVNQVVAGLLPFHREVKREVEAALGNAGKRMRHKWTLDDHKHLIEAMSMHQYQRTSESGALTGFKWREITWKLFGSKLTDNAVRNYWRRCWDAQDLGDRNRRGDKQAWPPLPKPSASAVADELGSSNNDDAEADIEALNIDSSDWDMLMLI